ncbi:MAG: hypothetical protein GYA55_00720 [SAR324 cluster bacterium]|uniref:Uncharacterized protein n=1 Tax=SAR324 cluster bacterium TaxID=2024889 RepID=A0A7X9FP28_9DELT|nr:hypothetical protein [SAR324 cluster bacterium]
MAIWCLPKERALQFKQALKDGTIDPVKMLNMTSQERREFLSPIVGERDAAHVNAFFESKMLNKNITAGMIAWAKRTMAEHPTTQKSLLKSINILEEKLNKKEITIEEVTEKFGDLINQRLGVGVNEEQFEQITELSHLVAQKQLAMEQSKRRELGEGATKEELEYGLALVNLEKYVQELKDQANKGTLSEFFKMENILPNLVEVSAIAKTLKATFDISYTLRQGFKVYAHNPKLWAQNTIKEFQDVVVTFGEDNVMDYVLAEIVSDPNYQNMKKDKLAINVVEEEYPASKALEKIPGFGKLHKASEVAYTAFAYRSRAQLYNYYTKILQENDKAEGNPGKDTTGRGLGRFVNSITGRGTWSSQGSEKHETEAALGFINKLFFSPRFLKSNLDFLTAHAFEPIDPVLKKQAAYALLRGVATAAAVLAPLYYLYPGTVEDDPKSADFGKIRIGNTRIDITGGMGSILVLASRLLMGESKSSTTGLITKYEPGYGKTTRWDALMDFFEGKLAPSFSLIRDLMVGEGYAGEKITPEYIAKQTLLPIIIQEGWEMSKDPNSANALLALIAEGLGMSASTYSANLGWEQSTSKKWTMRKAMMGKDVFNKIVEQANNEYNQELIKLRGQKLDQLELEGKINNLKKYLEQKYFGK